jgi:flap endonuclease-1
VTILGVNLSALVPKRKIALDDLSGKSVAVDAYNTIYQFLSIIRGYTGEPLMDRRGRVTSHLSGLFYRSINMIERGLKLVFVFDGKPPALKEVEIKMRRQAKDEASLKYQEAIKKGDMEAARRYAQMTARIKDEMVEDAKKLLDLLGIPWVQAPSEGEAQAASMAAKGDVQAAASQDYDSLLFGAPRLARNLAVTGRRKLPRRTTFIEIEPEYIELGNTLTSLEITREQLIDLGILVGTDYNPGGIKGIGPKTALKLITQHTDLEHIIRVQPNIRIPENYEEIRSIFRKPAISNNYSIEWKKIDVEGVKAFLCQERDFSEIRVTNALEKSLSKFESLQSRRTLDSFFK